MLKKSFLLQFLLVFFFLSTNIYSFERKTIAILDFENHSQEEHLSWLSKALPNMLITDLTSSKRLRLLDRENLKKIIKEHELVLTGFAESKKADKIGKVAKASKILMGSYKKSSLGINIEAHIVDVGTGKIDRVEWVKGKYKDIFKLEKELAFKVIKNLDVKLTEEERDSIRFIPTKSIDAYIAYMGAKELFDKDISESFLNCINALEKDKSFFEPRVLLGKIYQKFEFYEHALIEFDYIIDKDPNRSFLPKVKFMSSVCNSRLGRYKKAINILKELMNNPIEKSYFREGCLEKKLAYYIKQNKISYDLIVEEKVVKDLKNKEDILRNSYQLARKYKSLERYEKALGLFQKVIFNDKSGVWKKKAYWHLNDLYLKVGNEAKAVKMAWKMVEEGDDESYADDMIIGISDYYINKGDLRGALSSLELIINKYPSSNTVDDAFLRIYSCYEKDQNLKEAITFFNTKSDVFKKNDIVSLWCMEKEGVIHLKQGNINDAKKVFENCLKKYPRSILIPKILSRMAELEKNTGSIKKAEKLLIKAAEITKDDGLKKINQVSLKDGRVNGFVRECYFYPSFYYYKISQIYKKSGKYDLAVKYLVKAAEEYSISDFSTYGIYTTRYTDYYYHHPSFYFDQAAEIYRKIGNADKAVKFYTMARDYADNDKFKIKYDDTMRVFQPDSISFQLKLINFYKDNNLYKKAVKSAKEGLLRYPNNLKMDSKLANLLNLSKNYEKAINRYKKILNSYALNNPEEYIEEIGDIYLFKLEQPKKALGYFTVVYKDYPYYKGKNRIVKKIDKCKKNLNMENTDVLSSLDLPTVTLAKNITGVTKNDENFEQNKSRSINKVFTPKDPPPGMIYIPESISISGSDKYSDFEKPEKKVTLKGFFIDKYEVTNKDYYKFVIETGSYPPIGWKDAKFKEGEGDHPVVKVSWYEANDYAKWAGKRLPTALEWEKAARGNNGEEYISGFSINGSSCNIYSKSTAPVGSFKKDISYYGCYDMAGNVSEWTSTKWNKYNSDYILKGGNWYDYPIAYYTRPSFSRIDLESNYGSIGVGFRCAKDVNED